MGVSEGEQVSVLHVDDEPDVAEMAAEFLEREDDRLTVETASSASEGLNRLADGDVDCIVSDYEMSGMDGITFLERVREEYPDLPFILFTGKGSEAVASEAVSAGVTAYLKKETGTDQYTVLANRITNAIAQYRAERRVERTEERYRRLIEESTDVITVVDASGTFQYVSPAAEHLLGYTAGNLVGENVFEYIHPDDRESGMDLFADLVEHPERRVTHEFRFEHSDGSWIWLEVRGRNLIDDPAVGGVVVYARDITRRKQRERERQRQNERLEKFASVVSHDLRNPLRVAEGHLNLAREECDSAHLDAVADAHDRMDALIEDLLTFTRVGQTAIDEETVDLRELVERCWESVTTADASLVTAIGRPIEADPDRLQQLLENLLANAVEHGSTSPRSHAREDAVHHGSTSPQQAGDAVEHGGDGVTVTVGETADGTGFFVGDDGPGIPAGERENVFERGYSTAETGTGFGLSIVTEIAEAHDWTVTVTDSDDGGARFEITGVDFADE